MTDPPAPQHGGLHVQDSHPQGVLTNQNLNCQALNKKNCHQINVGSHFCVNLILYQFNLEIIVLILIRMYHSNLKNYGDIVQKKHEIF